MMEFPAHQKGKDIGNDGIAMTSIIFTSPGDGLGLDRRKKRILDVQATQLIQPTSFWIANEIMELYDKNESLEVVGRGFNEMSNRGRRVIFDVLNFQRRERDTTTVEALGKWEELRKRSIIRFMEMSQLKKEDWKQVQDILDELCTREKEGSSASWLQIKKSRWDKIFNILNEQVWWAYREYLAIEKIWKSMTLQQGILERTNTMKIMRVLTIPYLNEEIRQMVPQMVANKKFMLMFLKREGEEIPLAITYKNQRFSILDTEASPWSWSTNLEIDEGEPVILLGMLLRHNNLNIRKFEDARAVIIVEIGGDEEVGRYIPSYGYRGRRERNGMPEEEFDDIIY